MPRKCTICHHAKLTQINKQIAEGVSLRDIGGQFGMAKSSVDRHTDNCLGLDVGAVMQAKKEAQAFDFEAQLYSLYQRAQKMVFALEKWLVDPENPEEFDIGPRDTEMLVNYLDYNDTNEQGKPKRAKAMLADLLRRVEAPNNIQIMGVASMAVDNRKLYLDAFKTLNDRLEQIAKFHGLWKKEQKNPSDQAEMQSAVKQLIESGAAKTEQDAYTLLGNAGFDIIEVAQTQ